MDNTTYGLWLLGKGWMRTPRGEIVQTTRERAEALQYLWFPTNAFGGDYYIERLREATVLPIDDQAIALESVLLERERDGLAQRERRLQERESEIQRTEAEKEKISQDKKIADLTKQVEMWSKRFAQIESEQKERCNSCVTLTRRAIVAPWWKRLLRMGG